MRTPCWGPNSATSRPPSAPAATSRAQRSLRSTLAGLSRSPTRLPAPTQAPGSPAKTSRPTSTTDSLPAPVPAPTSPSPQTPGSSRSNRRGARSP